MIERVGCGGGRVVVPIAPWLAGAAALGGLVVGAPRSLVAQDVRVAVEVQSESGTALAQAVVVVEPQQGPAGETSVKRFEAKNGLAHIYLATGARYRIVATAAGHAEATIDYRPLEPATIRLVLRVDPYDLPPLRATVDAPIGRPVDRIRFRDASLTYASVGEWLADLPGIQMHGRGPGGRQLLSVRGSRPDAVLVLLDGAPLNDPVTGRADLSSLPTSTLESGTLVRGASSARYGSGASAGVLLLESRRYSGTGFGGSMKMGSFGGMAGDVQADVGGPARSLAVSLAAERADNDFLFRNPAIAGEGLSPRENADARSYHGSIRGTWGPVFGSVRHDRSERGVPGRAGTSLFDEARTEDEAWFGSLGVSGNRGTASASASLRNLGYRSSSTAPMSWQRVRDLRLGGSAGIPGVPLTLAGRLTGESVEGAQIDGARARWVAGATAAASLTHGRLRVDPALGLDLWAGRAVASPEVTIAWATGSNTRLWGRAAQGFRLPTFGDLYFASQYSLRPNPDLASERVSLDAEIGYGGHLSLGGRRLAGSVSGWVRHTQDPIVWLASSTSVWSPRNVGELRAGGVELQLDLEPHSTGPAGWRVQVAASVKRSRVGFGSNRNPLPYEPSSSGRLSVQAWEASIGGRVDLRYTGPRTTNLAATRTLPGFLTVDISGRHEFAAGRLGLGLMGRIENVTNQRYQLVELFPEPGRRFSLRLELRRSRA